MWLMRLLALARHPLLAARIHVKRCLVHSLASTGKGFRAGYYTAVTNPSRDPSRLVIGDHVSILGALHLQGPGRIRIGDYTTIRYGSVVQAVDNVEIGSHVIISHDVTIQDNNNHPTSPRARHELSESRFAPELNAWTQSESAPVAIEDHVWIGVNAVILKGVRIGRGSIVGACAVVTKDVPPFSVVVGNPGRVVKSVPNDLEEGPSG